MREPIFVLILHIAWLLNPLVLYQSQRHRYPEPRVNPHESISGRPMYHQPMQRITVLSKITRALPWPRSQEGMILILPTSLKPLVMFLANHFGIPTCFARIRARLGTSLTPKTPFQNSSILGCWAPGELFIWLCKIIRSMVLKVSEWRALLSARVLQPIKQLSKYASVGKTLYSFILTEKEAVVIWFLCDGADSTKYGTEWQTIPWTQPGTTSSLWALNWNNKHL